jgi:hypothetical protein
VVDGDIDPDNVCDDYNRDHLTVED